MDKKNFDFKLVDYNNLDELAEMFDLCFGQKPPAGYFEWKFLNNPAGRAIGYVAYHQGEVAGFYGVIPEQYSINEENTLLYQSMDTMTHPNYQRQGLFTSLAKTTYERLIEQDGDVFILGFPGLSSHPGFVKKLAWRDITLIDYIFLNKTVFKVKNVFSSGSKLSFNKISRLDETFDDYFVSQQLPTAKITQVLNSRVLNWRIADNPIFKFEILEIFQQNQRVGLVIYKMDEKNRCFIHYVNFAEKSFYEKFFPAVCSHLFDSTGGSFIYTFEPSGELLANTYRKNWFIKNKMDKGPFTFRPPFIGFSNREKIKGLDFFNIASYDLQPIVRDY